MTTSLKDLGTVTTFSKMVLYIYMLPLDTIKSTKVVIKALHLLRSSTSIKLRRSEL